MTWSIGAIIAAIAIGTALAIWIVTEIARWRITRREMHRHSIAPTQPAYPVIIGDAGVSMYIGLRDKE